MIEFAARSSINSGIFIDDVRHWISPDDIEVIKNAYPPAAINRRVVIFSSAQDEQARLYFRIHPKYSDFYKLSTELRTLVTSMRASMLQKLPWYQRIKWRFKKWTVAIQWISTPRETYFDEKIHNHPEQIVGILALQGTGTTVKFAQQKDLQQSKNQIYDDSDLLYGPTYNAKPGELVIVNAVHYSGGGLHAAPSISGNYPERLVLYVNLKKD